MHKFYIKDKTTLLTFSVINIVLMCKTECFMALGQILFNIISTQDAWTWTDCHTSCENFTNYSL